MPGTLVRDLRYAARMLLKAPGFTAVALTTLALGIGASTALFSVIHAVLLRPLPYREPERLVSIWESLPERPKFRVTAANARDWAEQCRSFEALALFAAAGFNATGAAEPEQLLGAAVSAGYFKVLGVEPALGRVFGPEDDRPGAPPVVILDHGLWQRRFGGRRDIVGREILLDKQPYTVVGVMPPGIYPTWPMTTASIPFLPRYQQLWVPLRLSAERASDRISHVFGVLARLAPGVTLEQAQTDMRVVAARLAAAYPEANQNESAVVVPLVDEVAGSIRPALLILLAAVGVVLLIACANIANLLLARGAARQSEIAIRAALGAGRGRLIGQLLIESLLLATAGGLLGIALAGAGIDLLLALVPAGTPRLGEVGINGTILAFSIVLTLLTALIFGLVPALRGSQPDLRAALGASAGGVSFGPTAGRSRRILVIGEVSLALLLTIASLLLTKSYLRLHRVDPGFRPEGVLVLELTLPPADYPRRQDVSGFHARLVEHLRGLPGVDSAAVAYDHPLDATWSTGFRIEGRPEQATDASGSAWLRIVSADYFRAAGIERIEGRLFSEHDDLDHPGAVIINRALARRYFPDRDPIGQRLLDSTPQWTWGADMPGAFEIVGVVRDVKFLGLDQPAEPAFYLPARQFPLAETKVLIRAAADPLALAAAARSVVRALDPDLPIAAVTTMEQLLDRALAQPRFSMLLLSLFGAVALVLAAVGLYGLLAQVVGQRSHEIGIRMALGAPPGSISRLILSEGAILTGVGLAFGCAAAFLLTRLLSSMLFAVSPLDPSIFLLAALLLLAVALLTYYQPARRAQSVDPIRILRGP